MVIHQFLGIAGIGSLILSISLVFSRKVHKKSLLISVLTILGHGLLMLGIYHHAFWGAYIFHIMGLLTGWRRLGGWLVETK